MSIRVKSSQGGRGGGRVDPFAPKGLVLGGLERGRVIYCRQRAEILKSTR